MDQPANRSRPPGWAAAAASALRPFLRADLLPSLRFRSQRLDAALPRRAVWFVGHARSLSLCPWPPIMRLPIYNRRRGRGGLGVGAGAVVVRFRAGGRSESETARCCARLGGYGRGRVRLVVGVSVSVWAAWHRLAGVRGAALAMRHWRRCQAGLGWGGVGWGRQLRREAGAKPSEQRRRAALLPVNPVAWPVSSSLPSGSFCEGCRRK